ncbi:MAG: patatin-like phospholipase family protein [Cyclobacteriaceae bacterium]
MSQLKRVLAIDGGGIRGIIPGTMLVEAEKAFNIKVWDYFDIIAGTSTGGILTCAYLCPDATDASKPKFDSQQVVDLYFEKGDEIFSINFLHKMRSGGGIFDEKYPDDGIEDALQQYFGDVWLKDLLKPAVVTSYDIKNRKGHFFFQHKAAKNPEYNFKIRDVSRATSAAPTYFECAKVANELNESFVLIDGGVFANNPAMVAYSEVRNEFKNDSGADCTAKDMKVLSLGTGFDKRKYLYKEAKNWGMAQWVKPIVDIMMSGSVEVDDYYLGQIFDTLDNPNQYLRVNGHMPEDVDPAMDNAKPKNLKALKAFGEQLFQDNKDELAAWFEI